MLFSLETQGSNEVLVFVTWIVCADMGSWKASVGSWIQAALDAQAYLEAPDV